MAVVVETGSVEANTAIAIGEPEFPGNVIVVDEKASPAVERPAPQPADDLRRLTDESIVLEEFAQ